MKRKYKLTKRKKRQRGAIVPKYNWIKVKMDYISDPTVGLQSLVKKYGMTIATIRKKAKEEAWAILREEIMTKAEKSLAREAGYALIKMKKRHIKIGKILQKVGLEAITKKKYVPSKPKEALGFIAEGLKIERQATGMDEKKHGSPSVINIVSQEKEIIDQYKYIEGEVVKDGKK